MVDVFKYKQLDIPVTPLDQQKRSNIHFFRQKVLGKLVRVTLVDKRVYVGKLQAIDWKQNIFLQSSSMIINKQNPLYYKHQLMKSLQDKLPESLEEFQYAGSVIVSAQHIVKMLLDEKLTDMLNKKIKSKTKKIVDT